MATKKKGKQTKKKNLPVIIAICVVLVAALVAGGIFLFSPNSQKKNDNVYTALYSSEVSTLNYLTTSNTWDQTVGANVIDTLVEYDSTGNVIPGLAETWKVSDDNLTWTFNLRKGVKWYDHTGKEIAEVTAQDFVDALKYVLTPANQSSVEYAVETANILNAEQYYTGEITDFAQVGVKAIDKYTLEYTLSAETPYFLSCLTYGCFMPAYGPQLEALGADFGTAADKMYYCGAFILTEYEPQVKHTYIKNVNNWDAANVHLDGISRIYNSEASTLAPTMAERGEVDSAGLSNDIIDDWKKNHADIVTRGRAIPDYSYFYCFNFDPQFDAEYEPENWLIAVNNANFRHSIMSAFDRTYAMTALEPDDPESLLQNTVTPAAFAINNGQDYTAQAIFDDNAQYFFNAEKALEYKAKAIEELTAGGCKFPVKIMLNYRSDDKDWESESILMKQQVEAVLGTDYVQIELYAGTAESFLSNNRRNGNYAMMRCNWGADYADPQTWTDPFAITTNDDGSIKGNSYNKMDKMLGNETFTETSDILTAYYAAVDAAKAVTGDIAKRYEMFAAAEDMLVENALVIPYNISPAEYQVTKLNIFEGEYAPFGMSNLRFKYQKLNESFITAEQYQASFDAWTKAMGK